MTKILTLSMNTKNLNLVYRPLMNYVFAVEE